MKGFQTQLKAIRETGHNLPLGRHVNSNELTPVETTHTHTSPSKTSQQGTEAKKKMLKKEKEKREWGAAQDPNDLP